ncbi:hypothetical protein [Campylobacter sp. RM16187]|uniref:hypothetical protein n=1 Tax=Campylobacter sp. RM16187 TaxID=1660063 RepID=UPI0021B63E6E|nr:hypothetical protein [Campylobacter sp. RM16187]QKG30033.1 putative membrane protein [Campylobacter sp. RM16187]
MQEFYEKPAFNYFVLGGAVLAVVIACAASLFYDHENLKFLGSFGLHEILILFLLFFLPSVVSFLYLKFVNFKADKKVLYNLFIMPFGEIMIVILLYFLLTQGAMIHEFALLFALLALPMFVVSAFQVIFAKFTFKG